GRLSIAGIMRRVSEARQPSKKKETAQPKTSANDTERSRPGRNQRKANGGLSRFQSLVTSVRPPSVIIASGRYSIHRAPFPNQNPCGTQGKDGLPYSAMRLSVPVQPSSAQ